MLQRTRLRSGQTLVIKTLHPPLGDYADQVGCWSDVREELLGGELADSLYTPHFVGEIDGEVAGSMSHYTPADTHDVGVVEFAQTDEVHRQKGVASALLGHLVERFDAEGGLALYLCTVNPVAGRLYENHGFWYYRGDGLRRLSPDAGDFDRDYLAYSGAAQVREAVWGDLPRACVLFNHPEPGWLLKDRLTGCYRETRYESHFVRIMKRAGPAAQGGGAVPGEASAPEAPRGAVLVLENPQRRVVGCVAFERRDGFQEQHAARLGFRVCPSYLEQAPELLWAAQRRAAELGISVLETYVAAVDQDQQEIVRQAGFSEEARLRNRLRDGDGRTDLLICAVHLPGDAQSVRAEWQYYGNRRPWQAERMATGGPQKPERA